MHKDFYEQAIRYAVAFAFNRENDYSEFYDLGTVVYALSDTNLINGDNCEVSMESSDDINSLKEWMTKEIADGFTCYNLEYHGDEEHYNIISTLPELIEVAEILGLFEEFAYDEISADDVYYHGEEEEEVEDEDDEEDEGEE